MNINNLGLIDSLMRKLKNSNKNFQSTKGFGFSVKVKEVKLWILHFFKLLNKMSISSISEK